MKERIPQSSTIRVPLKCYLASDHVTKAGTVTVAVIISKNGANWTNPGGAGAVNATEVGGAGNGNGWYYVDLAIGDTDTLGPLLVRGTSATIDDSEVAFNVVKAHNAGFDGVPDAVAAAANGLPTTNGTKLNQTVDLTASQSIACSDKTGFSLSATGADLILYTSTFIQAIKTALEIAGSTLATLLARIVGTVDTGTHKPQSGDAYGVVNDGTVGNAAIKGYVDDIGAAGAGLTALPAMILDLANGIETGLTPREAFRYLCAFFALVSGYPGGPAVFRNAIANSKVRLTVTHDANGNRTIIVSDLA
jgi:hypothetical protein